ncbi:Gp37 family protein [Paraburkholderia sp.]|uniref:Gp37 family protein n=1 Tax=Paraburkholderia sp. TaxID=1926495 RepID=UPI003D6DC73F
MSTPAMSLIGQIEDGLLAQLVVAFTKPGDSRPSLKVESWPTRSEGYRLTGAGDVFTIYKGTRYSSDDTSSGHYDAMMEFEITLRARTLRDQGAAYEMVESARNAICGQRLTGSSGVTLAMRDDFVDYAEGVFAYALVVAVPVLILQPVSDAPGPWLQPGQDGPLITQFQFNQESST